ncbi:malto-oligosyltrehalose trehalohydrolase [Shinella curvata]|uniref:Malto-oligosyltrehalose trehalohydrolase n=1 Tax=Shinella curvata TaxID=1817964 RepID=A0ABT8XES9_9HYPH|nr:malto-oligosyltrehalose trehalohydrolase [Shinella curvata]MCJ8052929.1 malto-oligosyltrehalose trehalohydrolase [Shinella curvata]MDO6122260.1 malto-oligosyltrehalose trehalohydrolase [Shinella curvata]
MTEPSMTRRSWGPILEKEGGVTFRLWAPEEETVTLVVAGRESAMRQTGDGWHSLRTNAKPGDDYAFRLFDGMTLPDPAAHAQAHDVHGPSRVVDHGGYPWKHTGWTGRPWEEAILYELHIGTFTPEGTFRAAIDRLPHLRNIGITAMEIMPVSHFAGTRGWGYDGVLPYAPHTAYGTPDDLKALIDAAHGHGIMVLLDVVYNHFGPVGNVLPRLAPRFFHPERHTPWGSSIAFDEAAVRRYFIENALHWLVDYRFDGLRFDATEEIIDDSEPHLLIELAETVRAATPGRHTHLVVEDQLSRRSLLNRDDGVTRHYTAGWNDEFHHALHVLATGETGGYYKDFLDDTLGTLQAAAAKGFARADRAKDRIGPAPQDPLPPDVNINFLQNHDQIGNRAFGDRLTTLADPHMLRVMTALLMLSPPVPLIFMGDEYGEEQPFQFFVDFEGELAQATKAGREVEAEKFGGLPEGKTIDDLPDPLADETFLRSKLDWTRAASPEGRRHMDFIRDLIRLRQQHIVPLLKNGRVEPHIPPAGDGIVAIDWRSSAGTLQLRAHLTAGGGVQPSVPGDTIFSLSPRESSGPWICVALDRTRRVLEPKMRSVVPTEVIFERPPCTSATS